MSARIIPIVLLLCSNALADISVEIVTAGFPGEGVSQHLYRGGNYAGLGVRVALANEEPRQVWIRVEQHDRDGAASGT